MSQTKGQLLRAAITRRVDSSGIFSRLSGAIGTEQTENMTAPYFFFPPSKEMEATQALTRDTNGLECRKANKYQ